MNKQDAAKRIKYYIDNTIVVPLEVVEGCRVVIGGTRTGAYKGNTVWVEGGLHTIRRFIHKGGFDDKAIIAGTIATAAELGPANGVTEDENSYTYGDLTVHKALAMKCLDEIIAGPKQFWVHVRYIDGAIYLIHNGNSMGLARAKGCHTACGYIVVGYTDHRHVRNSVFDHPIKDSHLYEYCLLERAS